MGLTTLLAMLGYSLLVWQEFLRDHRVEQLNWHLVFLAWLLLTGGVVAYQVHRVRALSRFYDRQP